MALSETERDEMLVRIDERTGSMYKVLFGNGRPGLVSDVAVLQDDMRRRELEAEELRQAVPTKRDKALVNSGVLTSVIVAVAMAIKTMFFGT